MKKALKSCCVLVYWCTITYGEILYLIEPYGLSKCYFGLSKINNLVTYNCSDGLKFSLTQGLTNEPGTVSFKLVANNSYLCHQNYFLRLKNIAAIGSQQDAVFVLKENKYYSGFFFIKSTSSYSTWSLRRKGFEFLIEEEKNTSEYIADASFNLIASDLNIKMIDNITRYSVNITINDFPPIWNISNSQNPFLIKYKAPNNDTKLFNVTGSSIVITSLDSYTWYEFSAGVKNEFGLNVFGNVFRYQTDEDIPTGPPLDFAVVPGSFLYLILSWNYVEYSKRKGIILKYEYSCQNKEVSILKTVENSTFQVIVQNLIPDTMYTCTVAACTKVGCGVNSSVSNETPSTPPKNLKFVNVGINSMLFQWDPPSESEKLSVVVGYKLVVKALIKEEDYMIFNDSLQKYAFSSDVYNGRVSLEWEANISDPSSTNFSMTNLFGNLIYVVNISVNTKNYGVFRNGAQAKTAVGVPLVSVLYLHCCSKSYDFLIVCWNHSPSLYLQGERIAYNGYYKKFDDLDSASSEFLPSNSIQYKVSSLDSLTNYLISVSATTSAGEGPFASVNCTTDNILPDRSAQILNIDYINSSSISLSWSDISVEMWGMQESRMFCVDIEKSSLIVKTKCIDYIDGDYSTDIQGLDPYTNYKVLVYCKNKAGIGRKDDINKILFQTDQLPPSTPPKQVRVTSVNTNNIMVEWRPLNSNEYSGVLEGYSILFKAVLLDEDVGIQSKRRRRNTPELEFYNGDLRLEWVTNLSDPNATKFNITNLFGNTKYITKISANTKYQGVFSSGVEYKTKEGVPLISVVNLRCCEISFDSLTACWEHTPPLYLQGERTSYTIYYGKAGSMVLENDILPADDIFYKVFLLEPNTSYQIMVVAWTPAGEGKEESINCTTTESLPRKSPTGLSATSQQFPSATTVTWTHIPKEFWQGQLLGYTVVYKLLEQGEIEKLNQPWLIFNTTDLNNFVVLNGLNAYSKYSLKVAGYNKIGTGPFSTEVTFYTCRILDPVIQIEYISVPPFVYSPTTTPYQPKGVMITSLEKSLLKCTSFCTSFSQKISIVYRELAMSSVEFEKQSSNVIKFPVTVPGRSLDALYSSTLSIPGFLLMYIPSQKEVVLKDDELMVFEDISSALRIFGFFFLLSCLFGTILFYCQHQSPLKNSHCVTLNGIVEGIYLAIITITTVGYGDKLPMTFCAKVFLIVWTLFGIALTGICVGKLLSALTVTVVKSTIFLYPKDYVIAKLGSPEFAWANKISSINLIRDKNLSTHVDVFNALKAGQAKYALLEQYTIEAYQNIIQQYGVAVLHTLNPIDSNYGVSLGGNYSILQSCMNSFSKINSASVDKEMADFKLEIRKQNSSSNLKPILKTVHLINADSPIFQKILYATTIVLVILWIAGGIYEVFRRKSINKGRVATSLDRKLTHMRNLRKISEEYEADLARMIAELENITDQILYKYNKQFWKLRKKFSKLYGVNFKYVTINDLGVPLETIAEYRKEIKHRPKITYWERMRRSAGRKLLWLRLQLNL